MTPDAVIELYQRKAKSLTAEARMITTRAEAENRNLTQAEREKVESLIDEVNAYSARIKEMEDDNELVKQLKKGNAVSGGTPTINEAGTVAGGKSLWTATVATGLKVAPGQIVHKRLTSGAKATMDLLDDATTDLPPRRESGIDRIPTVERYLFRQFAAKDIADDVAKVEYLVQVSRDLPEDAEPSGSADDTIMDFASNEEKPKAGTKVELQSEFPKMNAVLTDYVPNALIGRADLRGIVDDTCRLALNRGLDAYVVSLALASPATSALGDDLIERIVYGRQVLRDTGYSPVVTLVSSNDATAIELARGQVEGAFFGTNIPDLGQLVISDAVVDGSPVVLDPSALGDLYVGGLMVDADSFTQFSTNQTRFRYEHPTLFVVRHADAAVLCTEASA